MATNNNFEATIKVGVEGRENIEAMRGSFDKLRESIEGAGKSYESLSKSQGAAGESGRELSGGLVEIGGEALESAAGLKEMGLQLAEIVGVVEVAKKGLEIFKKGLEFNETIEVSRTGIAGIIAQLSTVRDANGEVVKGADALQVSYGLADEQLQKLQKDALSTNASFSQLVAGYKAALAAGNNAGLSLDQTRELVVKLSQAAGALGVSMDEIGPSLRAILSGTRINANELARDLGLNQQLVASWREQGTLVENLTKSLEVYSELSGDIEKQWTSIKTNLEHGLEALSGDSVKGFGREALAGMHDAVAEIFGADGSLSHDFKNLSDYLSSVFTPAGAAIGNAVKDVVRWLKEASDWIGKHREQLDGVTVAARQFGHELAGVLKAMAGGTGEFGKWLITSGALEDAFRGLAVIAAAIADTVKTIVAGFQTIGGIVQVSAGYLLPGDNKNLKDAGRDNIKQGVQRGNDALDGDKNATGHAIYGDAKQQQDDEDELDRQKRALAAGQAAQKELEAIKHNFDQKLITQKEFAASSLAVIAAYQKEKAEIEGNESAAPGGSATPNKEQDPEKAGQQAALATAEAEAQLTRVRAQNKLLQDENQRSYDEGKRSYEEYLATKHQLALSDLAEQEKVTNAEIAGLRKAQEAANAADQIKLKGDIDKAQARADALRIEMQGENERYAGDQANTARAVQKAQSDVAEAEAAATAKLAHATHAAELAELKAHLDEKLGAHQEYAKKAHQLAIEELEAERTSQSAAIAALDREFKGAEQNATKQLEILKKIVAAREQLAEVDSRIAAENTKAPHDEQKGAEQDSEQGISEADYDLSKRKLDLDHQVAQGTITKTEAEREYRQAALGTADALKVYVEQLEKMAAADPGNATLSKQAEAARAQMTKLSDTADQTAKSINDSFENSIEKGLENLTSRTQSLGGVLKGVLLSLAQSLQKILEQDIAQNIAKTLGSGSGTSGGYGGIISSLISGSTATATTDASATGALSSLSGETDGLLGLLGAADGGLIAGYSRGGKVRGPGTDRSDSVLARLSKGEFVVKAAAVRSIGAHNLHFANAMGKLPRFATGGLAGSAGAAGGAGGNVRVVNVMDPSLIEDGLSSPGGERIVLNHITKNARKISTLLGST